jgi:hypothetical protein
MRSPSRKAASPHSEADEFTSAVERIGYAFDNALLFKPVDQLRIACLDIPVRLISADWRAPFRAI